MPRANSTGGELATAALADVSPEQARPDNVQEEPLDARLADTRTTEDNRLAQGRPTIVLIAALRWEVGPLLKLCRSARIAPGLYRLALRNGDGLLAVGGVGQEQSYRSARRLIQGRHVAGVISIGFAGGLSDSLRHGDLVIASEVIDEQSGRRIACDTGLLQGPAARYGRLLSVRRVIQDAQEKRRLGGQWNALAADMESAGVARASEEAAVPFAALKAVTDIASETMAIDFQAAQSEHEEFSYIKVVRQSATSLPRFRELIRLAGTSRRAAGRLARAIRSI